MNLVEKIRYLANEKGMSIPDLEIELGLGNGTISRWRSSSPNSSKLIMVANYFGVSTDYLLGRSENPISELPKNFDMAFLKIMQDAKNSGISPKDMELAIEFLKYAKQRDGE